MSDTRNLEQQINSAFDTLASDASSDAINTAATTEAVAQALNLLDSGQARVAEKTASGWVTNEWLKKAVLLSFRLNPMRTISGGPGGSQWWDRSEERR